MKILLVSEYFPASGASDITGGVEARCFFLSKELSKKHDVTVLTSWRKGLERAEKIGDVKVIRVGKNHKYTNNLGFFSRLCFAKSILREGKKIEADIIDCQNFTVYLPGYMLAKRLNLPCVATYHESWVGEWVKIKGVLAFPFEIYERVALRLGFSKFICVSSFTKKRLEKKRIEKDRIVVIPNGIDLESLGGISAKKNKSPTLCFIGRLVKTKKADLLLRSVAILKEKIPDVRCIIIGQGEKEKELRMLAAELGIEENTVFMGFVKERKKVMAILKSSDVFCLPSTVEGFGIVIIEAMAIGTPYVCADIEVLREITERGIGGLLAKKDDVNDFSEKIMRLLSDKGLRLEKKREGLTLAKKYEWKKISEMTEYTYSKIIGSKRF